LASALDPRLAEIGRSQDAGQISLREAADLRVESLEHHLAALKALRAEPFSGE